MCKKQRTAIIKTQRQFDAIIFALVFEMIAVGPASLIYIGIDTIAWRRSRKHIGDQTFIPAAYLIFMLQSLFGLQCQYNKLRPPRVYQFHSTSFHIQVIRLRKYSFSVLSH